MKQTLRSKTTVGVARTAKNRAFMLLLRLFFVEIRPVLVLAACPDW